MNTMVELNIDLPPEILSKISRFMSHPVADLMRESQKDVTTRIQDMVTDAMGDGFEPFDRDISYCECYFWLKAADEWQQEKDDEYDVW